MHPTSIDALEDDISYIFQERSHFRLMEAAILCMIHDYILNFIIHVSYVVIVSLKDTF